MGKVGLAQARGILFKELAVACGNGIALGIAAGAVTYLLHGEPLLATVLGIALVANFLIAALVGSLIPLILRSLRADPAVAPERVRDRVHGHVRVLFVPRPVVYRAALFLEGTVTFSGDGRKT